MKEGWEIKKLGEVCDIICGQDYKSVKDDNGKYPIYGTGGIMGYASQYRCPANCVIIGRKGNINNPIYVETEFWNVDTAFGVVPKSEIIHPKFFYLFCKDYDFTKHDVSVTIPSLRRTDIIKIDVPIPPIAEQEKIVAELDCLSGIIEKKKQQLKEYDALAQSIFYEMFGEDEGKNNGWTTCQVGDVYKFQYGKGNKIPENKGEYPCYGSNGQVGFHVEYNAEDSPIIGHIGAYAGIVIWASGKHYVTYNGVICNLINKDFDPIYAYHMLKSQNYMEKARGGAAQPFVSYDVLREPIIYVPPLALQQEFASKIEATALALYTLAPKP